MHPLVTDIINGSFKSLARAISLVENGADECNTILTDLPNTALNNIIGITGPPGAGKSTLVDAMIGQLVEQNKTTGVLCVDPSSPFNLGALLGDRIRMNRWYNHPNVFIRSLATRGSLGGLHPSIIEITDVMKAFGFDNIIIETVGVGQSEVEIAGLADTTIVVLVPEGGDEVQSMKAGLMEIADIFVVNKADRPGADTFVKNLRQMLAPAFNNHSYEVPVIKTVASESSGIQTLLDNIEEHKSLNKKNDKQLWLMAEKAFHIIKQHRMKDIDKSVIKNEIETFSKQNDFNFYKYVDSFINQPA